MARARRAQLANEPVDGVLLLDKPSGITSNLALQKARRLLNAAKAGHTGTLDPLAGGLLPLAFGEATKFSADLIEADKAYEATLRFGVRTTTGDAEGEVIETRAVALAREQVKEALARFVGAIEQVPPMHSALKYHGRPLYALARQGVEVERAPRTVKIERLQLLEFGADCARVEVECSKGTYVRVLAEDIGAALGCGAHLSALRRTRVGSLSLAGAVELAALEAMPPAVRREWLLPADALLASLARIELNEADAGCLLQGQAVATKETPSPRVRVYGPAGLLGVASIDEKGKLVPLRLVRAQ